MIRKMGGDKREWSYPILDKNNQVAVTDRGKADLLAITFVDIHSGRNLSDESKRGRKRTKGYDFEALGRKESTEDVMSCPFSIGELKKELWVEPGVQGVQNY